MTQPARAIQTPNGRVYPWPSTKPYEFQARSVTTLLGAGIPKTLHYWAAKQVAEFAVQHVESWRGLPYKAAFELLKESPWRTRDGKGEIGDKVHDFVEQYTGDVIGGATADPEYVLPLPFDPDVLGYCNAFLAFNKKWKPEYTHSEVTIYSRTHRYAGSTDNIANFDFEDGRGPVPTIIDYKTSKRVYDDVGFQLVAYAKGDFIAGDDDEELPLPEIRDGLVVRLGPDGKYTAVPFHMTDELFDVFLAACVIANRDDVIQDARRRALNSRPRKEAA